MHETGPDSIEAKELIKERNDKIEKLCEELDNTIVFIIADHGHKVVSHVFLGEYKDLLDTLERTTSLEQRAVSFHVKENRKEDFKTLFHKYFGNDFNLYTKEEVIESNLFGDGEEHPLFRRALGDFIAITENSSKCLIAPGDDVLFSHHAGYSDDEIYVPLIIIDKTAK